MKKLYYILVLLLPLNSCKKPNNAIVFEGNYHGTFRTLTNDQYLTNEAEVNLSNLTFTVLKGQKLGSGSFHVNDKMNVTFNDKNVWTTDFDFGIILNGTYKYEALGDSLILTKYGTAQTKYYQYRLKRTAQ